MYKKSTNKRKKYFYVKTMWVGLVKKKYWNKTTNILQNPTSVWALLHTTCVAQVNVRAFTLSATYIVSIVRIQ